MAKSKEYQSAYSEKKSIKETIEYSDRLGGGRSSVSIQVEFRGTPEEKDRAMEISGYIVGKIMGKAKTTGFALENPYIASENEKQFAEKIKEKLGKNATMQDYMEYAVSVSPDIKYLKSEKSASAVIRKYGDKVPTDAIGKISNFISSKKINQLKNAHRQKTEETKRKTQEFVKKNGYLASYSFGGGSNSIAGNKKVLAQMKADGIRNSMSFPPVIVTNYKAVSSATDHNLRQAICQVDRNNFIIITNVTSRSAGFNFKDMANYMVSLNCRTGFNLDGGGSINLYYKKNNSTLSSITTTSRKIADILYFVEK